MNPTRTPERLIALIVIVVLAIISLRQSLRYERELQRTEDAANAVEQEALDSLTVLRELRQFVKLECSDVAPE